jgi:hypothetical protein
MRRWSAFRRNDTAFKTRVPKSMPITESPRLAMVLGAM